METRIFTPGEKKFLYLTHLLLLPLFFVFHGYVDFFGVIFFRNIMQMFAQYLLATIILLTIFFVFFKNFSKASILTFFVMAYHFFFGPLQDEGKKILGQSFLTSYSFILPFSLVLFILLVVLIRRSHSSFYKLHLLLSVLFTLFVAIDLTIFTIKIYNSRGKKSVMNELGFVRCDACGKPDTYFIVLDGYAGQNELTNTLGFDNSAFENDLKNKGFRVIKNSKGNYNSTPFSLASTLNMSYLNVSRRFENRNDLIMSLRMINKNEVADFFSKEGYQIKSYSVFNFNNIETKASDFTLFEVRSNAIYNQTFLSRVKRDIGFYLVKKFHLQPEINKTAFATLSYNNTTYNSLIKETNSQQEQPRFIYAHLIMPHWPYYYSEDGKLQPTNKLLLFGNPDSKAYIEYLEYCNKKINFLIDQILLGSKKKAIIMLISDHGFREFTKPVDPKYLFYNLSSIYLPSQNYKTFYDGMSNVNLFRSLLNAQFGQSLPRLQDSTVLLK